ncbi:MAG: ADP-ribosylglycohydrolase family protein [Pirellulales bacterium]|nr:ADP-ribosylglycohydrolase family protein [Pirellulales bacterium]
MKTFDQILGCIFGGAIGDAYGGPYEGTSQPVRIDETLPWRLSDDTQLTLATCESITQEQSVQPAAIAEQFRQWFVSGRVTGLGASTLKALTELAQGGHWALVGRKGEMAAGNSAAMRIAPLAFLLDPADPNNRRTIRDVCRITHHHDEAYTGALAVVAAVRMSWSGSWTDAPNPLENVTETLPDCRVRDRLRELSREDPKTPLSDIASRLGCSGYVVDSVPLALCAAARTDSGSFHEMLRHVVTCGGDTDTIAAIAGQVTGARLGLSALPASLLDRLPNRENILATAQAFAKAILKNNA